MTVVDRWRRKNSRWRPFAKVEKSRKIAVEAVSPMPSRLVTSESRLLKKISFWSLSVKNLVSGLESTRPWPGVDSWVNSFLTQFCTNFCLRPRVGSSCLASRLLKKNLFSHVLWSFYTQATSRLVQFWESTPEEILHKSQFCKNHSSGLESFLQPESRLLEIDSWTLKLRYASDTPWNLSNSSTNLCPLNKGLLWLTFPS